MKKHTPDPLAPWSEKKEDSYGLSFAKMIGQDWFNGSLVSDKCEYADRRDYINKKRKFVRGEQSIEKFKKSLSGDLSLYNQDFRVVNFGEKFCRIVSNGINDENYMLDIRANDRLSLKMKQDRYDNHLKNMRTLPLRKKAEEVFNIPGLVPDEFIPQDEEELKIYSEINERPKIEIAEEIVIDYIKKSNNWDNTEDSKNKDLTDIGICAARVYTDKKEGIKLEYIDPEYLVHGPVVSNDFSKCNYYGYLDPISIGDIYREGGLDEIAMRKIAKTYSAQNQGYGDLDFEKCKISEIMSMRIDVLRFSFKTFKKETFKKNFRKGKTVKVSKREEDYNAPKRKDYEALFDVRDTWMEGSYIIGSDYIYGYQECENIVRDELNKALPPFIVRATDIYKNKLHSFLDNIETIADGLNETVYKIRHLRSQLRPDLIAIDIDALADLSSAEGAKKEDNWKIAIDIIDVKGVSIGKNIDMGEAGMKNAAAARPVASQQGSALTVLFNLFAADLNLIRETTGINPARDGSLPSDALLGVNQMAQLASNTVTKHIVVAATDFNKRIAETISSRVHSIFRNPNAKSLKDIYTRAVGKQNVEALEAMKNRHLHDFGFSIEMLPAQKEIQDFIGDLTIALQEGSIDVEIKAEAQRVARVNMKLAHQYLFYMRKKRIQEKQQQEQQMLMAKSQSDIQSNTAATQNKLKSYQQQKQIDLIYNKQLAEIEVTKEQMMQQVRQPVADKEFEQEVYLEKLKNASVLNMRAFQEKAKDDRLDKQSTQQSQLIDQRKHSYKQPVDFEFKDVNPMI
ncbi:hypothetical protein [Wenyingzhuangia sp. 2_MG-2023]|uniref:hypothetical protein n=1 Tax=Wenyingzhuangia sp. 2_MG-2023 TaxID=3062639 RepID=UPI0026E3B445|nr:hypothetical protein [Wenyingzhuangia sp. 2_MG-2023]MDO6737094.1 hypothetical protein [Wenyingzhuangia sp. 2_MG-2023]